MRTTTKILMCACASLLLSGCIGGNNGATESEASPAAMEAVKRVQVPLSLEHGFDQPIRIGVLAPPMEDDGSEYRPLAEGVGVAAYRFALGGADVQIVTALDNGTAAGATAAVQELIDAEVSGIVCVATGPHIAEALALTSETETPVILPFGHIEGTAANVWSTAPSPTAVTERLGDALAQVNAIKPAVISEGHASFGGSAALKLATGDPRRNAQAIIEGIDNLEVDSVIIEASATDQAAMVVALYEALGERQIPVVLTPSAVSPGFSEALSTARLNGGWLLSVGPDVGDLAALTHGDPADALAAFFSAVRLGANDPGCSNIYGDDACATTISNSGVPAHDATVALVRAADSAGSVDPATVGGQLASLRLDHAAGLAGPSLDFSSRSALPDRAVVVLHSISAEPGLRSYTSGDEGPSLYWFSGE